MATEDEARTQKHWFATQKVLAWNVSNPLIRNSPYYFTHTVRFLVSVSVSVSVSVFSSVVLYTFTFTVRSEFWDDTMRLKCWLVWNWVELMALAAARSVRHVRTRSDFITNCRVSAAEGPLWADRAVPSDSESKNPKSRDEAEEPNGDSFAFKRAFEVGSSETPLMGRSCQTFGRPLWVPLAQLPKKGLSLKRSLSAPANEWWKQA